MLILLACLCAVMTVIAASLIKTYRHVPRRELKRRAQEGDELSKLLFKAASYGSSLAILLWLIVSLAASGFFVATSRSLEAWQAVAVALAFIWAGFIWTPNTRVSRVGLSLATLFAGPLAWLLRKTYPLINFCERFVGRWQVTFHTGLYEKEDLLEFLDRQTAQFDNRLSEHEVHMAKNALTFSDKIVRDVMVHIGDATKLTESDVVGPILLTELHDSGHNRFPVFKDKKSDKVVGTLFLRDLLNVRSGESVKELMNKNVHYMHDEEPLDQALYAFLRTHRHMFIVVNSFEDVVGLVTLEDILSQMIGEPIEDDFDAYQDPAEVAKHRGKKLAKRTKTSESSTEVVE